MSNNYTQFGAFTLVPQADLLDLQSAINKHGDTRVGGDSSGKSAGMIILCDEGSSVYSQAMAYGANSSDKWMIVDGDTTFLPVNILNAGGGAAWTLTTATYTGGLLTATGASAVDATQNVTLKAGTYRISGSVNRHTSTEWVQLTVTGATDGAVLTKAYSDATVDATDAVTDGTNETFTLAATSQAVTFDLSIKDAAGNATGAAYTSFIVESF